MTKKKTPASPNKNEVQLAGFKLYPHQYYVAKELESELDIKNRTGKIVVVNACRQVGKSILAINELVQFSSIAGSSSALVTTSFRLARTLYDTLIKFLSSTPLVEATNAQALTVSLKGGSSISFFSAEQREKLRGYTISGILIIDEAAFISDSIYYNQLRPWVNVTKAPTLILSTPDFERGFFFDLLTKAKSKKNPKLVAFDFMEYKFSIKALRPDDVLDQARENLPPQTFRSEYLGLFKRADGSVFGYFEDLILQHQPDPVESIYFGIDWGTGSGKDYTVISAFNQAHQLCYLWRSNTMDSLDQVDFISKLLDSYGPTKVRGVIVEENSIGKLYLSLLSQACKKYKIQKFNTSNKTKRGLIEKLQIDIQNKKVWFMDDRNLKLELASFEMKLNSEGHPTWGAPVGLHDDIVMSVLMANRCFHINKSQIKFGPPIDLFDQRTDRFDYIRKSFLFG